MNFEARQVESREHIRHSMAGHVVALLAKKKTRTRASGRRRDGRQRDERMRKDGHWRIDAGNVWREDAAFIETEPGCEERVEMHWPVVEKSCTAQDAAVFQRGDLHKRLDHAAAAIGEEHVGIHGVDDDTVIAR